MFTKTLMPDMKSSASERISPNILKDSFVCYSLDSRHVQIYEDFKQGQPSPMTDLSEQQPSSARESVVTPVMESVVTLAHNPEKRRKVEEVLELDKEPKELLSLAFKYLTSCEGTTEIRDKFSNVANIWAQKMRELDPQQSLFAEKAINDILFEARMCSLNKYSVKINEPDKEQKVLYTGTSDVCGYTTDVSYPTDVSSSFK
ncbi:uncharacterized protein [Halyomorpha halys]